MSLLSEVRDERHQPKDEFWNVSAINDGYLTPPITTSALEPRTMGLRMGGLLTPDALRTIAISRYEGSNHFQGAVERCNIFTTISHLPIGQVQAFCKYLSTHTNHF